MKEEEKAVSSIAKNPKYFYSYAKKSNIIKSCVGHLLDKDNNYEFVTGKMADLLQKQYTSVFSTSSQRNFLLIMIAKMESQRLNSMRLTLSLP